MKLKRSLGLLVILLTLLLSGCSEETSAEEQETVETEEVTEEALVEVELMNGAISMKMPEEFSSMKDELITADYPPENIPDEIYVNAENTVNIIFKHDDLPLAPNEIDSYIEKMTTLLNDSDTLVLLSSGVNEVDGHDIGYLNIVTEQGEKQIYNSVWVTSLEGKAFFGSVNCYDDVAVEFKPIAEDMYKSIQFN